MIFFSTGSAADRADRILDLLDLFGDREACALHADRAGEAYDPETFEIGMSHASLISALRADAETQSLSRRFHLSPRLAVNAATLEEAYAVLVAAIRDGVCYEDAQPDWRVPFLDTLPQDGSYRSAVCAADDQPLPLPANHLSVPLCNGLVLVGSGTYHWIVENDVVMCGPGKTAIRIASPEVKGRGTGAVHCAAERLLNLGDPKTQCSLTIGGYKSRSRAWDLLATEARALGLTPCEKGDVPAFEDLEDVLNADAYACGAYA